MTGTPANPLPSPLNLPKWLSANSHLLQPPIGNFCIYDHSGVTVMVVGGPNARSDYHINTTAEWFFQYSGGMLLKVVEVESLPGDHPRSSSRQVFRDIHIAEGEMFLLPPNTPHNPVRFANTVGIVIEQHRPEGALDTLRWYCPNEDCRSIVHDVAFVCKDLGTQVKQAVEAYTSRPEQERTCAKCGKGVAGEKPVLKADPPPPCQIDSEQQ